MAHTLFKVTLFISQLESLEHMYTDILGYLDLDEKDSKRSREKEIKSKYSAVFRYEDNRSTCSWVLASELLA